MTVPTPSGIPNGGRVGDKGTLPSGLRTWILGARPRTLPAAVVPVAVGTGVAAADGLVRWERAALALVVALALQVGVNFANDYSDGIRGTDDVRVGPIRLVAGGLATPQRVKRAAFAALCVAALAGLGLAALTTWWLLLVGAVSILAAWTYTGGPRPYGYAGFGEVFVFVFFGVVAVVGSAFVQNERLLGLAWCASIPIGLLAVALLLVNNLRDIPGDSAVGKQTLAVRVGDPATRSMYALCVLLPASLVPILLFYPITSPYVLLSLAAVPLALAPLRTVHAGAKGPALIPVLGGTARYQLGFGALLTLGLALSRWAH